MRTIDFTKGKIMKSLILFAGPVLFAMFLQALYSAADLLIVGKFATKADVSGVAIGSQLMTTLTNMIVLWLHRPAYEFKLTFTFRTTRSFIKSSCTIIHPNEALYYDLWRRRDNDCRL